MVTTANLHAPEELDAPPELSTGDRVVDVAGQRIAVNVAWWDRRLHELGLPGGPLRVNDDIGARSLTREDVWSLADGATSSDEGALRLLWHALAWGLGRRTRLCKMRTAAVRTDVPAAAAMLRRAAELSRSDPKGAYDQLHRGGSGRLRGLGPAFGTKYLYFAGGGAPTHPSFILDQRCASALRKQGWTGLRDGAWSATTYDTYCRLVNRWSAQHQDKIGTPVVGDQIEKWLFEHS
jgi:hypothetical protein